MPERPSLRKRMSRQESDLVSLRTEREANKFPISKPPFIREDTLSSAEKEVSALTHFSALKLNMLPGNNRAGRRGADVQSTR